MNFNEWWHEWREKMPNVPESTCIQLRPFMKAAFNAGAENVKPPKQSNKFVFKFDESKL